MLRPIPLISASPSLPQLLLCVLVGLLSTISLPACSGGEENQQQVGPGSGDTGTGGGSGTGDGSGGAIGSFAQANGRVSAIAPDGSGGIYVCGDFTEIGNSQYSYLAHILANGQLDPAWNPRPDGTISTLHASGPVVYVGGGFTSIGGEARNYLAALDGANGHATPWDAKHDRLTSFGQQSRISAFLRADSVLYVGNGADNIVDSGTLYFGGNSTAPSDQPIGEQRFGLTALDAATGALLPWNPAVSGYTVAFGILGSSLFVGGKVEHRPSPSGPPPSVVKVNRITGQVLPWDPLLRSEFGDGVAVLSLVVSGDLVYLGGYFSHVGGQPRRHLTAVDATTALPIAWNPNPNGAVTSLVDGGQTLYVGGGFTVLAGAPRRGLAAFDKTTGLVTPWNPDVDGSVQAMAVHNGRVFIGGRFTSVGGQPRSNLAVIDANTGHLLGG